MRITIDVDGEGFMTEMYTDKEVLKEIEAISDEYVGQLNSLNKDLNNKVKREILVRAIRKLSGGDKDV